MASYRFAPRLRRSAASLLLLMASAGGAEAQNVIAYPAKGQSQEQQDRDRFECFNWAVQQTGFNPQQSQQVAQGYGNGGGSMGGTVLRGAAGGAALGAVGGAIAGNAGKGAAIGAGAGGLFNGLRHRMNSQDETAQLQSQANANAQRMAGFNRAMGACLQGRGYSVS